MKTEPSKNPVTGVQKQVFDQFLKTLGEKGVATHVIERLKNTIIEQNKLSEVAIKAALFTDDNTEV